MEASTCQMCLVRLHPKRPQWVLYHQVVFSNQEEAFLVDGSHQTIFWLHYLRCLMALVSQIEGGINVVGNHAFGSSNINGVTGSITGISSSSASGNHSSVPGLGVSPVLGNVGPRLTSFVGKIVGSGNMGRSISFGGLSVPGLASRVNLATMHRARRITLAPITNIFVYL
ncbi:probable NOT transcription complex subunit VIP2 [Zingiber officinale]|uniref:probable NOT transcription complex subunit VIP2 n=1 Tax=Zingiber officinale TaxID=94328 RepID=UPI001C4BA73F|nr:probable NOT transcription complex subunit VIP2 [Zingiber officinale]